MSDARTPLDDVQDKLEDLGFREDVVNGIDAALHAGFNASRELRSVTGQLMSQLSLCSGAAAPAAAAALDDAPAFVMGLGAYLQSQAFPDDAVLTGWPAALSDYTARTHVLDFLLSELQAARMCALRSPPKPVPAAVAADSKMVDDAPVGSAGAAAAVVSTAAAAAAATPQQARAREVSALFGVFGAEPPANVGNDGAKLLQIVNGYVETLAAQLPPYVPLFQVNQFNPKQVACLEEMNAFFASDYSLRRAMLLKRLEVTAGAFMYTQKARDRVPEMRALVAQRMAGINPAAHVHLYELLCATRDCLEVTKVTDSVATRHTAKCFAKRHIIGAVPDRGGRTADSRADGTMPALKARTGGTEWTKNANRGGGGGGAAGAGAGAGGGGGRGGRGRGRGGGRGGRVQGGWGGGQPHGGQSAQTGSVASVQANVAAAGDKPLAVSDKQGGWGGAGGGGGGGGRGRGGGGGGGGGRGRGGRRR